MWLIIEKGAMGLRNLLCPLLFSAAVYKYFRMTCKTECFKQSVSCAVECVHSQMSMDCWPWSRTQKAFNFNIGDGSTQVKVSTVSSYSCI